MIERRLTVAEPTPEGFRPFGQVVCGPAGAPDTANENLEFWSELTYLPGVGELAVALCHAHARTPVVAQLENHRRSFEALIPLEGEMVLPVARYTAGEGPKASETALFHFAPGMMLILDPGIWHWLPYPQDRETGRFLVLFRRGTSQEDLFFADLDEAITF